MVWLNCGEFSGNILCRENKWRIGERPRLCRRLLEDNKTKIFQLYSDYLEYITSIIITRFFLLLRRKLLSAFHDLIYIYSNLQCFIIIKIVHFEGVIFLQLKILLVSLHCNDRVAFLFIIYFDLMSIKSLKLCFPWYFVVYVCTILAGRENIWITFPRAYIVQRRAIDDSNTDFLPRSVLVLLYRPSQRYIPRIASALLPFSVHWILHLFANNEVSIFYLTRNSANYSDQSIRHRYEFPPM